MLSSLKKNLRTYSTDCGTSLLKNIAKKKTIFCISGENYFDLCNAQENNSANKKLNGKT